LVKVWAKTLGCQQHAGRRDIRLHKIALCILLGTAVLAALVLNGNSAWGQSKSVTGPWTCRSHSMPITLHYDPFDTYYLDINFSVPFSAIARFQPQFVSFFGYSSHYVWKYATGNSTYDNLPSGARINYHMNLDRRVENAYPVILPLAMAFLALGATVTVDSKEHLDVRATIYVALFVFVIGFVPTINTLVPSRASGVTVAEITAYSLGTYLGIFLVCSILAHFPGKSTCSRFYTWALDAVASFAFLILLTTLHVVSTPYSSQTLFDLIPSNSIAGISFKSTIFVSLLYGLAIARLNIARHAPSQQLR
jgi:hypothetical protein